MKTLEDMTAEDLGLTTGNLRLPIGNYKAAAKQQTTCLLLSPADLRECGNCFFSEEGECYA